MPLPTLHVIAPFHTRLTPAWSHCAFTQKAFRFPKMMHLEGYKVVEYANACSESDADEKVPMLSLTEFEQHYPAQKPSDFHGSYAVIGERGWPLFNQRLIAALLERVKPGDLICHVFGRAHQGLPQLLGNVVHTETGIGYPDKPFGCFRIFESEAWRHYHWGRDDGNPQFAGDRGMSRLYTWVVPNYFDTADWPYCPASENKDYVLFMGRITPEKGMQTIVEIIRADAGKTKFVFAGQGDFEGLIEKQIAGVPAQVLFVGPVHGRDRAKLVGEARCMLMPTDFIEPFGGSGVEAMLTGTPLLASPYGAFTETVQHGLTGYLCHTLGDWLAAIEASKHLSRRAVSFASENAFSLKNCAKKYDAAFRQMADLSGEGWYRRVSYRVPTPTTEKP